MAGCGMSVFVSPTCEAVCLNTIWIAVCKTDRVCALARLFTIPKVRILYNRRETYRVKCVTYTRMDTHMNTSTHTRTYARTQAHTLYNPNYNHSIIGDSASGVEGASTSRVLTRPCHSDITLLYN